MAATKTIKAVTIKPVTTNAFENKTLPDIFYEDPEPIEDALQQQPTLNRLTTLLLDYYKDDPEVFVMNAGFVSYNRANGNDRVAPDCYITFGVDAEGIQENLPNFWIWETGKVPDFVLEVASESTAANDLGRKRDLYQRLGVAEYWRFDGRGGKYYGEIMVGERLVDGEYQRYQLQIAPDGSIRGYSELLDLEFYWDGAEFDILDPRTGKTIDKYEIEREAHLLEQEAHLATQARAREDILAAETRARVERQGRITAEDRALAERERRILESEARITSEAQAQAERQARQAAEAQARQAQERERELLAEIERLRRTNAD